MMEKRFFSKKHTMGEKFFPIVAWALSALFIGFGVFLLLPIIPEPFDYQRFIYGAGFILFGLAFGTFQMRFGIWFYSMYALSERGITIQYQNGKTEEIPWASVSQICVYDAHEGGSAGYDPLIWCAIGKIKHYPPYMPFGTDNEFYEFRHRRSAVQFEYSPERLEAFRQYYQKEIPDYRYSVRK